MGREEGRAGRREGWLNVRAIEVRLVSAKER